MGLFNIKDSREDKLSAAPVPDANGHIIQMIEGEVIDVGSEVTGVVQENKEQNTRKRRRRAQTQNKPEIFSYRYKFTHPITGETIRAYDDLVVVEVGEQIYDIGEKVPLIFSDTPNKTTGNDFSITRKIIFPEIIGKKKRFIKIFNIIYTVLLFLLIFVCMCYNLGNQPVQNNADVTTEQTTEIEK